MSDLDRAVEVGAQALPAALFPNIESMEAVARAVLHAALDAKTIMPWPHGAFSSMQSVMDHAIERAEVAEAALAESRADAERWKAATWHYWQYETCPCGARIEAPDTHSHVGSCPVGIALAAHDALKETR